jgi:hypothetical protein
MAHLDLVPTGGRWGSITRVKRGTMQLFSSTISLHEAGENYNRGGAFAIADKFIVFWDPKSPQQTNLFKSTVRLSETFYDEIINNKVPIDLRALYALKRSPMALDIYCWLTFRMSYLKKKTVIPWEGLQAQFGAGYPFTARGKRNFKSHFLKQLIKVLWVYKEAKVEEGDKGLLLRPSKTHIPVLLTS